MAPRRLNQVAESDRFFDCAKRYFSDATRDDCEEAGGKTFKGIDEETGATFSIPRLGNWAVRLRDEVGEERDVTRRIGGGEQTRL